MILKSVEIANLGPFALPATVYIDPEVTVLTGPNDTGKSCVLRLIELACTRKAAGERDINTYRIGEFPGGWQEDAKATVAATFELTAAGIADKGIVSRHAQTGDLITLRFHPNQRGVPYDVSLTRGNAPVGWNGDVKRLPTIISLPLDSRIKEVIDLSNMTPAEKTFVTLGFGSQFSLQQHQALNDVNRSFRIGDAETRLNARLQEILSPAMPYRFHLREISAKPELLGIALLDGHKGHSPIESRGEGVQRIVGIMGSLLAIDAKVGHTYVLFDEPEASLHADAQHFLRRLLESLASKPNIQVIYATHSPAMINTMRPGAIRVVKKTQVDDKATTIFDNQPFGENYCIVRSSLGITPADSLLYAPITIIVEGITEVRCLPLLLKTLANAKIAGFDDLDLLLSHAHFLDGCGSSFEYMCRLAESQGATTIVFLDGDKAREAERLKKAKPDVAIVLLPDRKECEDMVPQTTYFEALAHVIESEDGQITLDAFEQWREKAKLRPTIMFSKQVERWLQDISDVPLNKTRVMEEAIKRSNAADINAEPFRHLLKEMRTAMEKEGEAWTR